jgi:hypothetical protein
MQVEQNLCEQTILSKNSDGYLASKQMSHDFFTKGACSFPSTTLFPALLTFLGKGTNMRSLLSYLPTPFWVGSLFFWWSSGRDCI